MLKLLDVTDRLTMNPISIIDQQDRFLKKINYMELNEKLELHVHESRTWLAVALEKSTGVTVMNHSTGSLKKSSFKSSPIKASFIAHKFERRLRGVLKLFRDGLARSSTFIKSPRFISNDACWKIVRSEAISRLQLQASAGSTKGKHVWMTNLTHIKSGIAYELTIKWRGKTESPIVNIHLRNKKSGMFKVIGRVAAPKFLDNFEVERLKFIAPDGGYDQVMLGAVHFSGESPWVEIESISVVKISLREIIKKRVPLRDVRSDYILKTASTKSTSKVKPSEPLAIPDNIPNREQQILNVLKDSKVQGWKRELEKEIPDLSFYVGREIKEYMNNKVGGPADILAFPKSFDDIKGLIEFAGRHSIPYTVLGNGSNVIVRDGGIRGIVILTTQMQYFRLEPGTLVAGAGSSLIEAAYFLLDHSKSGLEWAAGIPGTIGGAVWMNAGTYTSDVRSNIKSVKVIDRHANVFTLEKDEIEWGVRYTTFQDRADWVIVEARFNISNGNALDMAKKMTGTVQSRENNMPMELPNHGSTFKWYRAPRLIKQAGLVGTRIGGVKISEKQPGFFVNVKQGTASDYEALINYTISKVYEFSGFMLEPEVQIIGERTYRYKRYDKNLKNDASDERLG